MSRHGDVEILGVASVSSRRRENRHATSGPSKQLKKVMQGVACGILIERIIRASTSSQMSHPR